jgi:threonine synthase
MSIWQWASGIAPVPEESRISLGEGVTPILRSRSIGPKAGLKNLFFKLETTLPSGSYKDRFAVVAVSHMVAQGKSYCIASSSGNTGAALAAYCAAAGIRCEIAIVETAPMEKLKQMLAYGAELMRVRGFGLEPAATRETLNLLAERGRRPDAMFQISSFRDCPIGMTGVQTIAYELARQLERTPPHHVFCCAGGGGLAMGVARGYQNLLKSQSIDRIPKVEVVQPEGNATIAGPMREGKAAATPVICTTKVSGLQVASLTDGQECLTECRATGGTGHLVADEFVWNVQARMAREEGIFCEPAAAVPLAGALKAAEEGLVSPDATIVCMVTGSGFKDSVSVDRMVAERTAPMLSVDELAQRFQRT